MAKMLMLNPAPRKRKKATRKVSKRRSPTSIIRASAAPSKRKRYRRNPIGRGTGNQLVKQTIDSFIGAGGAIATDMIAKNLPLPIAMQTGYMQDITRAGIAIALGMVMEKGLKQRATGRKMTEGALTVIAHGMAVKAIGPSIGLSGYDSFGTGISPMIGTGMGAYQSAAPINGLGAYQQDQYLQ